MLDEQPSPHRCTRLDSTIYAHPSAIVKSLSVGAHTKVFAFSHIMEGAVVGRSCKIGEHVFVEAGADIGDGVTVKNGISVWDGVTVEDDVFLGPHMVFTNVRAPRAFRKTPRESFEKTLVKKGATVGAGATLLCGITIGEYAFVGAGSVVTKDVPPFGVVMGNPARLVAFTCHCLATRLPATAGPVICPKCTP